MIMGYSELVKKLKQPMSNTIMAKFDRSKYDLVQLKYDGWWCVLEIKDGVATYITAGAEVRNKVKILDTSISAILVGEWMYGTHWSQTHKSGHLHIHDIYRWNNECFSEIEYAQRLDVLRDIVKLLSIQGLNVSMIDTYPSEITEDLWRSETDFEGLVFKSSKHTFGGQFLRIKRRYTLDYVATKFVEGSGRLRGTLGAIQGSLWVNGELKSCVSVGGGFTDSQREQIWLNQHLLKGRVFEASGFSVFSGRTLRHPAFLRWRDDKKSEDCV